MQPNRELGFDPSHPEIHEIRFRKCDQPEFYRDAKHTIPEPKPRGNVKSTNTFANANHADDKETRWSQTGISLEAAMKNAI